MVADSRPELIANEVNVCRVELTEYETQRYRTAIPEMEALAAQIQNTEYLTVSPEQVQLLLAHSREQFDFHLTEYERWGRKSGKGKPLALHPSAMPEPMYADGKFSDYRDKFFEKEFGVHRGGAVGAKHVVRRDNETGRMVGQYLPSWFIAPWFRFVKIWWEAEFDVAEAFISGGRKKPKDGKLLKDPHFWSGPKGGWQPSLNQPLKLAFFTLPTEVGASLDDVYALFKDQKGRGRPIDG